ncbi:pupal cuticle protein 36a-like [Homarus americanus]|uniref:pupal cuticle protein 36a-like n=1 Tax=Homarus americanus TaxID=6706 RepID=UPI001C492523|nr:pupal cuticle protein 36a-like [Homarus americanus]
MKLLIFASLLAAAADAGRLASPQYRLPTPSGPGLSLGGTVSTSGGSGFISGGSGFTSGGSGFTSGGSGFTSGGSRFTSGGSGFISGGPGFSGGSCGAGQIRHVDGSCVTPTVTRNLYVYTAPDVPHTTGPRPDIPPPRVEHNVIFIRAPEGGFGLQPVVVPPPQQRNVVYVLNKRTQHGQQVVHVPAPEPQIPQVYFVNYADGENPTLPSGVDLQSALSSASHGSGEVIVSGGGSIGGGGSIVSGGGSIGGGGSSIVSSVGTSGVTSPSNLYGAP